MFESVQESHKDVVLTMDTTPVTGPGIESKHVHAFHDEFIFDGQKPSGRVNAEIRFMKGFPCN